MAQPLPTASMSAIVACRAKLVGILDAYAGRTIAGDAYLTLCRELAGSILRGGKSSAADQFDTGLDHRDDTSAIYASVQALLAGKTMTADLAKAAAFRLAGNLEALRAGKEITEFRGLRTSYWGLARIRESVPQRSPVKKLAGSMLEFGVMSGEAAGEVVSQFFTDGALRRMAKKLRIVDGKDRRYVHPREFVGCALMLRLEMDAESRLAASEYAPKDSLNRQNRLLTDKRRIARKCPRNFDHPCTVCPVNYFGCSLATHGKIYIEKLCPKCHNAGWVLGGRDDVSCLRCQAAKLKMRELES